jgi:hypothetical protein
MAAEREIDHSLYSRQYYVYGKEAMEKMAKSTVLISGQDGVGVEVCEREREREKKKENKKTSSFSRNLEGRKNLSERGEEREKN